MIRLAIESGEQEVWNEVAPRLRGASVELIHDGLPPDSLPHHCDAVVFDGSTDARAENVERWLRAGKHVLLVTGSCLSYDVVELGLGVASQCAVQLAIVNPDHYLPSRQAIRRQLDAGNLGEPVLVRIHRWESTATENSQPRGLLGLMVRDLEMASWLIGSQPNSVFCVGRTGDESGSTSGRIVQVHLGFAHGAMALLDWTNRLPPGDRYQTLSVIGSAGAAYADDHQNMQLLYRGGHPKALRTDEGVQQWVTMVQEFVGGVEAGRDLSTSVAAWREVLTVTQAVERSIESRQAILL